MHMEPGKLLTPSDHIYIILTLSTTPIQIPIRTRPSFPRADWNEFKEILSQHHPLPHQMTPEDIDRSTEIWTNRSIDASTRTIALVNYRTLPHYKTSHRSRLLQIQYDALKQNIENFGPSHDRYRRLN